MGKGKNAPPSPSSTTSITVLEQLSILLLPLLSTSSSLLGSFKLHSHPSTTPPLSTRSSTIDRMNSRMAAP